MDIQLIIVIIIGIAVAAVLIRNTYRFFFVERKNKYCGGCTGCSMSKEWQEEGVDPYRQHLG